MDFTAPPLPRKMGIESPDDLYILQLSWESLLLQLTPLNQSQVVAVPSQLCEGLDDAAKFWLINQMRDVTAKQCILIPDVTAPSRYLLGPYESLKQGLVHQAELVGYSAEAKEKRKKVPRPANAFMLYRASRHKIVKMERPECNNSDISIIIGSDWAKLDPSRRAFWHHQAERVKEAFMRENPGYKYQPRKSSEKKRRARRAVMNRVATGQSPFPSVSPTTGIDPAVLQVNWPANAAGSL